MFSLTDWCVVAAYLVLTTLIGAKLSGKQSTIRDFFLGGKKLPWWAISGSIVATEISAATFIGVPSISFQPGGSLTYLQLGIGAILARVIVGLYFVPRYHEHEIYSPYDYMGERLGPRVKQATTLLFFIGAMLGHGARLFITAILLQYIARINLVTAIWVLGAVGVCWTFLGGITTVIWTDVVQFCVLVCGALTALWFAIDALPGSVSEAIAAARAEDKFQLFNLTLDPSVNYTLWVGILAMPFLNVAAFGLDQVMAQRMFCCKTPRDATKAIIWSSVGQLVALIMLFVGLALFAYYRAHPLEAADAELYKKDPTNIFPMFIAHQIPPIARGLIVAAVISAAISTYNGALTALSQATMGAFKSDAVSAVAHLLPKSLRTRSDVGLSRLLIVAWGIILCLMATASIAIRAYYHNVIDLALGLTAYTYGALLGIFLLAFFPTRRDDTGLPWAVPMAMLSVFALSVHTQPFLVAGLNVWWSWSDLVVWLGSAVILSLILIKSRGDVHRTLTIVGGVILILLLHHVYVRLDPTGKPIYPTHYWSFPISTLMTFGIGYGLGHIKKSASKKAPARASR